MNKKKFFKDKQIDHLPVFFKNQKITEFKLPIDSDDEFIENTPPFVNISVYHSEFSKCTFPLKPVSKIIKFNE